MWQAATVYATWRPSERIAIPLRVEWCHDEDGTRVGAPATLLGVSLGADWAILNEAPTLRVRPEIRYDRSLDGDFYEGGADADQVSLTLDVLLTF